MDSCPTLAHSNQQPPIIIGDCDVRPTLRIFVIKEDQLIVGAITGIAQRMIEDLAVIHLLAPRHLSHIGITRMEEPGIVALPSNARRAGAPDFHRQQCSRFGLNHLQIADF